MIRRIIPVDEMNQKVPSGSTMRTRAKETLVAGEDEDNEDEDNEDDDEDDDEDKNVNLMSSQTILISDISAQCTSP